MALNPGLSDYKSFYKAKAKANIDEAERRYNNGERGAAVFDLDNQDLNTPFSQGSASDLSSSYRSKCSTDPTSHSAPTISAGECEILSETKEQNEHEERGRPGHDELLANVFGPDPNSLTRRATYPPEITEDILDDRVTKSDEESERSNSGSIRERQSERGNDAPLSKENGEQNKNSPRGIQNSEQQQKSTLGEEVKDRRLSTPRSNPQERGNLRRRRPTPQKPSSRTAELSDSSMPISIKLWHNTSSFLEFDKIGEQFHGAYRRFVSWLEPIILIIIVLVIMRLLLRLADGPFSLVLADLIAAGDQAPFLARAFQQTYENFAGGGGTQDDTGQDLDSQEASQQATGESDQIPVPVETLNVNGAPEGPSALSTAVDK